MAKQSKMIAEAMAAKGKWEGEKTPEAPERMKAAVKPSKAQKGGKRGKSSC